MPFRRPRGRHRRRNRMNPFLTEQLSRLLHPLLSTAPAPPPQSHEQPNVLVVKPASLGDVLMSTAFLAALRARVPQADITVLVTTWAKEALIGNPHCDQVLDSGTVGFPGRYGFSDYRGCVSRVRERGFTHCFVLDRSPLMALLPRLAGIPWRAGLNSARRGIALHVGVPCPADRHEAEIYLDVLRKTGIDVVDPRLHFSPQPADEATAQDLLVERGLADAVPLIAVHPGGGANPGAEQSSKRWSPSNFGALVAQLSHALGARILLVGGPDDAGICKAIEQESDVSVVNVAGLLRFAQLGALIQRCHLFIGNDSSPMHLAAAVGTPVVALFGPTSPQKYGPYGAGNAVVRFDSGQGENLSPDEVESAANAAMRITRSR